MRLAAAAWLMVACDGCYDDLAVDEVEHVCNRCRPCEPCVHVPGRGPVCVSEPQVRFECRHDGVHGLNACGDDEGLAAACPAQSTCEQDDDAGTAACICNGGLTGAACDVCPGNWDAERGCRACRHHWAGDDCEVCPGGFDPAQDCAACRPNYTGDGCDRCNTHWQGPECSECPEGFSEDDNCDAVCGNGNVDMGEACDVGAPPVSWCRDCRIADVVIGFMPTLPPAVAIDAQGTVLVFHDESDGTFGDSLVTRFAADGTELEAAVFSSLNRAWTPCVAVASDGAFVVGARDYSFDVWWDWYTPEAELIDSGSYLAPGGDYGRVACAPGPAETMIAAWASSGAVRVERLFRDGPPLEFPTTMVGQNPDLAVDVAGGIVAVWEGDLGSGSYAVEAQRFDASGNAVGSAFTVTDDGAWPDAVYLTDGTLAVSYQQGSTIQVLLRGSTGDVIVNAPEPGQGASIAALPGGGFALAFVEDGMWVQTFDAAGTATGDPVRLDPFWHPLSGDPQAQLPSDIPRGVSSLATDAQGRIAVTWASETGVSLQRLSPALQPLGLLPW